MCIKTLPTMTLPVAYLGATIGISICWAKVTTSWILKFCPVIFVVKNLWVISHKSIFPWKILGQLTERNKKIHRSQLCSSHRCILTDFCPIWNIPCNRYITKVIINNLGGEQFLWNRIWDLSWFWDGWQT